MTSNSWKIYQARLLLLLLSVLFSLWSFSVLALSPQFFPVDILSGGGGGGVQKLFGKDEFFFPSSELFIYSTPAWEGLWDRFPSLWEGLWERFPSLCEGLWERLELMLDTTRLIGFTSFDVFYYSSFVSQNSEISRARENSLTCECHHEWECEQTDLDTDVDWNISSCNIWREENKKQHCLTTRSQTITY